MPGPAQDRFVEHEGLIQEVTPGRLKVSLVNTSGCGSCHARALCNVSETDNKVIEITGTEPGFSAGDRVKVVFEESLGAQALIIGYVIPFFVVMAVLLISWSLTAREALSGLLALGSLAPYYLGLLLFRKRFRKTFVFTLKPTFN